MHNFPAARCLACPLSPLERPVARHPLNCSLAKFVFPYPRTVHLSKRTQVNFLFRRKLVNSEKTFDIQQSWRALSTSTHNLILITRVAVELLRSESVIYKLHEPLWPFLSSLYHFCVACIPFLTRGKQLGTHDDCFSKTTRFAKFPPNCHTLSIRH